jgi:CYTH domain-containing protein
MATEIERKFLIPAAPDWLQDLPSERIAQGYLAVVDGEREVRIRRKGDQAALTVKSGSGETRREEEIDLSADQFEALWPLTEGARVFKTRYRVPYDGATIERTDTSGSSREWSRPRSSSTPSKRARGSSLPTGSERRSRAIAATPTRVSRLTGDQRRSKHDRGSRPPVTLRPITACAATRCR